MAALASAEMWYHALVAPRHIYASVPNCQHEVTVSLKAVEVIAHDRASRWKARSLTSLAGALPLPALGLSIPAADIYRWTPLGEH